MEKEIEKIYNEKLLNIKDDAFKAAKIKPLNMKKRRTWSSRADEKNPINDARWKLNDDRLIIAQKDLKVKTVIDFDRNNSSNIKFLAVKKDSEVKVTTQFMSGKLLTFAKASFASFIYDVIDVFYFLDDDTQDIYSQNKTIKCFSYLILTDTDSASLLFVFVYQLDCEITETSARELIFEIVLDSKIRERLYLSNDFYAKFDGQDESIKKQVGLYEIQAIHNPTVITVAVNLKEYLEKYRNKPVNKKHKGM